MYLAYLDESGDSGLGDSPTRFFVLSCVLVHESVWLHALDSLIALRRDLRDEHGIATRPEIKSRHFHNGRGPLRHVRCSRAERMELFRGVLRQIGVDLPVKIFSIAVDKAPARGRGWEARMAAWTFAPQRIERFAVDHEGDWAMIFPDEGHGHFIRFIQAADWAACVAHRSRYVDPVAGVPDDLWDGFGPSLLLEVNRLAGGPPGIVLYPP